MYVVGGSDAVVKPESASPFLDAKNVRTLIGHDHSSITRPAGLDDDRYRVLKQFLHVDNTQSPKEIHRRQASSASDRPPGADPLFDFYTLKEEPYYLQRSIDLSLEQCINSGHVWVTGVSGAGKTASLRRVSLNSRWQMKHLMLSSYVGNSAENLFRAMCIELLNLQSISEYPSVTAETYELIGCFKNQIRALSKEHPILIIVEELQFGRALS